MYCRDCGSQLSLRYLENEGLVPFCEQCGAFKFPYFPVAVSMTVVNRPETKILLARHTGEPDYKLFAGYIKQGESAEKTIPRELKEETKLNAVKWRYYGSRYHDAKNVLMFNFIVTADEGEIVLNEEIEEAKWFTPEEARAAIKKNSTAEYFLLGALNELGRKK